MHPRDKLISKVLSKTKKKAKAKHDSSLDFVSSLLEFCCQPQYIGEKDLKEFQEGLLQFQAHIVKNEPKTHQEVFIKFQEYLGEKDPKKIQERLVKFQAYLLDKELAKMNPQEIWRSLSPSFTKRYETNKAAYALMQEALSSYNFDDLFDSAIHCKIYCTMMYILQMSSLESEIIQIPVLRNEFLGHLQRTGYSAFSFPPFYKKIITFVMHIPSVYVVDFILVAMEDFASSYRRFINTPPTPQQLQALCSNSERDGRALNELIQKARAYTNNYAEAYSRHQQHLLSLCEKSGIDNVTFSKRQVKLCIELFDKIASYPAVVSASKDINDAILSNLHINRKYLQQYITTGKVAFNQQELIHEMVIGCNPIFPPDSEPAQPEALQDSSEAAQVPADPWSVVALRKAYQEKRITKQQTLKNLCKACRKDERAKATSFLLHDTIARELLDEQFEGHTPLEHAVLNNSIKNVKELLKYFIKDLNTALGLCENEEIRNLIINNLKLVEKLSQAPKEKSLAVKPKIDYSKFETLLQQFQDLLNAFEKQINYLNQLLELRKEELEQTDGYQKYSNELTALKTKYEECKHDNWEQRCAKIKGNVDSIMERSDLNTLEMELHQRLLIVENILEQANKLPVKLGRAGKALAQLELPKQTLNPKTKKKAKKAKNTKVPTVESSEQHSALGAAQPQNSGQIFAEAPIVPGTVPSEPHPALVALQLQKPKLLFSTNMLFWQHERIAQSSKIRCLCEFNVEGSNIELKIMQFYAIIYKIFRYMEIQKNSDYLPAYRRDAITLQIGIERVAMIRNVLAHALDCMSQDDLDVAQELENFKSFGKLLAKSILSKNAKDLLQHPLFARFEAWGKSLKQDSQSRRGSQGSDLSSQIGYLFQFNSYILAINTYDENTRQSPLAEMRDCAIKMLKIRIAKYCSKLTAAPERRDILTLTHITPIKQHSKVETDAYVEEQLRNDWSERSVR